MTEATPYTLAQVEQEIYDHYQNAAVETKRVIGTRHVRNYTGAWVEEYTTVQVQETGHLGALWSLFDLLIEEEN